MQAGIAETRGHGQDDQHHVGEEGQEDIGPRGDQSLGDGLEAGDDHGDREGEGVDRGVETEAEEVDRVVLGQEAGPTDQVVGQGEFEGPVEGVGREEDEEGRGGEGPVGLGGDERVERVWHPHEAGRVGPDLVVGDGDRGGAEVGAEPTPLPRVDAGAGRGLLIGRDQVSRSDRSRADGAVAGPLGVGGRFVAVLVRDPQGQGDGTVLTLDRGHTTDHQGDLARHRLRR